MSDAIMTAERKKWEHVRGEGGELFCSIRLWRLGAISKTPGEGDTIDYKSFVEVRVPELSCDSRFFCVEEGENEDWMAWVLTQYSGHPDSVSLRDKILSVVEVEDG